MEITAWTVKEGGRPMERLTREASPAEGEVLIQVAGCGVCHTDLGYFYEGVPTRHGFPLTLGHEVSGRVVEAGRGAESWLGRQVIVPAVMPCGHCAACQSGHGTVCPKQIFPGCDVHGGFASHLVVPAQGLCAVPDLENRELNPGEVSLWSLAVIADAVSTPYQAILRSGLGPGDLAVFVGAGGVGGFGVQIAAALGARVVALDTRQEPLDLMLKHGAHKAYRPDKLDFKSLKQEIKGFARKQGIPTYRHRIFETSGTPAGQQTAFGLLSHGAELSVVGYTPRKVEVRLSNLMALDATARGNWGCLPEYYPAVLDLVLSGKVAIKPFVEPRPLASINDVFAELREGKLSRRIVLHPER